MSQTSPPDSSISAARLAVTSAALSADAGQLYNIASRLLGDGVPFERILFELLIPAERDLGHRWQQGDYLVADEHAATAAIETVISLLAGSFDQPEDGVSVVVATAEGDDHSLPSRALAAHLLYLGYRTVFLGANVLAADLTEFLLAEEPEALIVSCAMTTHLPGARAVIKAGHDAGVGVIAGGKGFGTEGQWARVLGADAWVSALQDVETTLQSWDPSPEQAEESARDADEELTGLIDRKLAVIGQAEAELHGALESRIRRARARDELGLLFDSLIASLLVDDVAIVADMLAWQAATLSAHRLDFHVDLARSMQTALEGAHPAAEQLLATALDNTR